MLPPARLAVSARAKGDAGMTQDSLDLGFPDTHREIRALTATGMDEAQAEAIVYATIRASAASETRLGATMDTKFREVDLKFQQVDLKFQQVLSAIERLEKDVAKDIEGVRKELDAKLANRLLALGLGQAALILGAAGAVIAVVVNTG